MCLKNKLILSVAGSGKTSYIIEDCYINRNKEILITTFTNNNTNQIRKKIEDKFGYIPQNITIQTWFSFLLKDWAKPYAYHISMPFEVRCVNGMVYEDKSWKRYTNKQSKDHYFTDDDKLYANEVAEFGFFCNNCNKGLNIKRLEEIYEIIYIDELQDLSGYDLEILKLLLESKIKVVLVGDPRQRIIITNKKMYMKKESENIFIWIQNKYSKNLDLVELNKTYRCSKTICDFVNKLYPDANMIPNNEYVGENPILISDINELKKYIENKKILILGLTRNDDLNLGSYLTIGSSKGLEVDFVVLVTTSSYLEYITKNKEIESELSKRKLYVAATRAKYGFVFYNPKQKENKVVSCTNQIEVQKQKSLMDF